MAQYAHVPKFENAESALPIHEPPDRIRSNPEVQAVPKDEKHTSRTRKTNPASPLHQSGDKKAGRTTGGYDGSSERSPLHQSGDKKAGRTTGGYDGSSERSPLHLKSAVKGMAHAVSSSEKRSPRSPSSEGNRGHAPNTPMRSRLRTRDVRADETPEEISAVPEFGKWDDDPSLAGNYTGIFEQVKVDKENGSAKVPIISNDSKYLNNYKQDKSSQSLSNCCFSWCKK